jgi:MFS family permease
MEAWRSVHIIFGAAVGLMSLLLLRLPEPARRELGDAPTAAFGPAMRELWTRRAFLIPLFIGQIGVVMADVAATGWAAPILSRNYGQKPEQFAVWMFGVIILSGIFGSLLGGVVADRGTKSRKRGGLLIGAVIASGVSIPAALFSIAPSAPVFAFLLAILLLCGTITGLITTVSLTTLIPNESRGVCLGMFIVISAVVGLGVAPSIAPLISNALGGKQYLAQALAYVNTAIAAVSFVAFLVAQRTAPRPVADAVAVA